MIKFIIGDLIHLPQSTLLYNNSRRTNSRLLDEPTIATYLGRDEDNFYLHKVDIFGTDYWMTDYDMETINFVRDDVYKTDRNIRRNEKR